MDGLIKSNNKKMEENVSENMKAPIYLEGKEINEMLFFELISKSNRNALKYLLSQNTFNILGIRDQYGRNLISFCSFFDDDKSATILIDHILKFNVVDGQNIVKNWINEPNLKGYTPILFSSYRGNINLIRLLTKYGADIHSRNLEGLSVMHIAAIGDQPISIEMFSQMGIDPEIKDNNMRTPLHHAAELGSINAFHLLLSKKINFNLRDINGFTPLHYSIKHFLKAGNNSFTKVLLNIGADVNIKNEEGLNCIEFAKKEARHLSEKSQNIMTMLETPKVSCVKSLISTNKPTILYLVLTYLFLVFGLFTYGLLVSSLINSILCISLIVSYFTIIILTFILSIKNPGTMTQNSATLLELLELFPPIEICPYCQIVVTRRSRHCIICKSCIERYDHHCPWINMCIGINNHNLFYFYILFLFIIASMSSILGIFLFFSQQYSCVFHNKNSIFCFIPHKINNIIAINVLNFIGLIISLFFCISSFVLVYVQTFNFLYGRTTNERFGSKHAKDRNRNSLPLNLSSCITFCCFTKIDSQEILIKNAKIKKENQKINEQIMNDEDEKEKEIFEKVNFK